MEVYDALYEHPKIRYIGVRDERSGAHMADGFGRISGRPGVMLAGQAGPGSANLVTGLLEAQLAHSPMVAITGLVSTSHMGRDTLQEFDQHAVFSSIVKRNWNVFRADRIGEFVREAVRYSTIGRKGPVVLNIPRDLFSQPVELSSRNWDSRSSITGSVPARAQLDQIATHIRELKRRSLLLAAPSYPQVDPNTYSLYPKKLVFQLPRRRATETLSRTTMNYLLAK